jgi:hypothetical protein
MADDDDFGAGLDAGDGLDILRVFEAGDEFAFGGEVVGDGEDVALAAFVDDGAFRDEHGAGAGVGDDADADEEARGQIGRFFAADADGDFEGAALGIDDGADAFDPALEGAVGQEFGGDDGGLVDGDDGEVAAGDEDAGDDFVEFDEGEYFGAGGDAGADLDVAGDDDAVEGGAHGGVGVAEGRALEAEAGLVELEFLGFVVLLVDEFAPVEVVGAIEVALELFEIDAGFIGVEAELGVLDFEEGIAGFDDAALLGEEGFDLAGGLRVEVDGGLGFEGGVEGEEGRNGAAHDGGGFDGDFFDGVLAGAVFLGLAGGG